MTLHFTPQNIEDAYIYLSGTAPFNKLKLPHPDDMEFRVTRHKDRFGHFDDRDGKSPWTNIAISTVFVKTTLDLHSTLSHELCHLALYVAGDKGWHKHGRAFKRLALAACRAHGFDPKTF